MKTEIHVSSIVTARMLYAGCTDAGWQLNLLLNANSLYFLIIVL